MAGNRQGSIHASAYVICQDEACTIKRCLASVSRFADIVVVDSGSTDGTLQIVETLAREVPAIRLIKRPWPGYAEQKQFALEACKLDWCLNLDADEMIDDALAAAIDRIATSDDAHAAFELTRREWFPGYGYAHPWSSHTRIVRLVHRHRGFYDITQRVHESLSFEGRCKRMREGSIWHRPHLNADQNVAKHNRYSTLKSEMLQTKGSSRRPWRMLTAPFGYYFRHYVLKRYFLCGWAGFAISVFYAQYAFQTEWKLWLAQIDDSREHSE